MKNRIKILIPVGVLLAASGIVAWKWETILRAYIFQSVRTVTTSLPHSDGAEVFYLDGRAFARAPADRPKAGEGFPIRAYIGAEAKILGRRTLDAADAEALAILWRAQTFDPGLQALCHSPAYGLRFYSGSKVTFETSLCFHCSNFYVTNLTGSGWWGFDAESLKGRQLLQRFQEIFPDSKPKPK